MIFDSAERALLTSLADVLIPVGEGFPSASEAGVGGDGLDQVLAVRPDLAGGLKRLLTSAGSGSPAELIKELQAKDRAAFDVLAELVPAAYFLNPLVRKKLGYEGQNSRPIDPRQDYLEEGLLQSVIDRGPIYRSTPPHQD